jgi:intracellular sulfur oxidation DsrE/DsrF family protein
MSEFPRRGFLLGSVAVVAGASVLQANEPTRKKLAYPIIPDAGGVVVLPKAAEQPLKDAKGLIEITSDAVMDAINAGLDRTAKVLNLYGAAGLKATDVKLAVVAHGAAVRAILSDAAYKVVTKEDRNPNLPLLRELRKAGVDLFVCGQALHAAGHTATDVAEPVQVADSFLTVMLNRQADGYAYIPGQ